MTVYFPSSLIIKNVLAGDGDALKESIRGKGYQELDFSHKKLEGNAAIQILKALKDIRIASINFTANLLSTPYLAEFMKHFADIDTLRLNLARNGIRPQGAIDIAENLGFTKIKSLNLSYNELGPEGAAAIYQSCSARNIQVDLSHNGNWRYRYS